MAATADTAKLLASLDLQDNMSPKLRGAVSGVQGAETAVGRLGSRLSGFATSLRGGISSALTTFTGRLKSFATAGLGILGIGGAFAIGKEISDSITKAREFGEASRNLAELLKLPVEETSRLSDALDYFGIKAADQTRLLGMAQKNIATYTATTDKAKLFQQQFGLSLYDSNGQVLTGTRLLLAISSYWDQKGIPQQTKVLALSKLFSRNYQTLLPLLREGRAEFEKQLAAAMHLSQADLDAIIANDKATKAWNDSLGDLQTQVGIHILPTLTGALQGLTRFVTDNGDQILETVDNIIAFGKGAVSTIIGVAEELGGIWDKIPKPFRDFISGPLLKLALGEKVIKFLFGFSPVELAVKAGGGLVEGVAKAVGGGIARSLGIGLVKAGIGKAFVQPVFVTNPGFGGGGGGPGAVAAGRNWTGIGATIAGAVIIPAVLQEVWNNLQSSPFGATFQQLQSQANANVAGTENLLQHGTIVDLQNALAGLQDMHDHLDPLQRALYELNASGVKTHTETLEAAIRDEIQSRLDDQKREDFRDANRERRERSRTSVEKAKGSIDWQKMADTLKKSAAAAVKDVAQQLKNANLAASRLSHQRALTIASRMETHLQSTVHVTVNTRVSVSDVRKASYSSSSAYDTAVNTFGNKVDLIGDLGP